MSPKNASMFEEARGHNSLKNGSRNKIKVCFVYPRKFSCWWALKCFKIGFYVSKSWCLKHDQINLSLVTSLTPKWLSRWQWQCWHLSRSRVLHLFTTTVLKGGKFGVNGQCVYWYWTLNDDNRLILGDLVGGGVGVKWFTSPKGTDSADQWVDKILWDLTCHHSTIQNSQGKLAQREVDLVIILDLKLET